MSESVITKGRSNYVAALQVLPHAKPNELMPQTVQVIVDEAFRAQTTNQESATPIDRSLALGIRLVPITLVWLVLSVGIVWAMKAELSYAFILFAMLTVWSYYKLDASERYDSPVGVEHHRLDAAERLASQKMEYEDRRAFMVTEAFIRHLEGASNDTTKATKQIR